jgi:hypothetical protein
MMCGGKSEEKVDDAEVQALLEGVRNNFFNWIF